MQRVVILYKQFIVHSLISEYEPNTESEISSMRLLLEKIMLCCNTAEYIQLCKQDSLEHHNI